MCKCELCQRQFRHVTILSGVVTCMACLGQMLRGVKVPVRGDGAKAMNLPPGTVAVLSGPCVAGKAEDGHQLTFQVAKTTEPLPTPVVPEIPMETVMGPAKNRGGRPRKDGLPPGSVRRSPSKEPVAV